MFRISIEKRDEALCSSSFEAVIFLYICRFLLSSSYSFIAVRGQYKPGWILVAEYRWFKVRLAWEEQGEIQQLNKQLLLNIFSNFIFSDSILNKSCPVKLVNVFGGKQFLLLWAISMLLCGVLLGKFFLCWVLQFGVKCLSLFGSS